jgi:cell fate regulator YaaT (PSP1 superfamily)
MYTARTIALRLGLEMKLSDVEYQGDKSKAIFYYTADARVDFRELIKVLAEEFKVRIEMRQIGARQEASRLGGIGSCGRELCCSTWLTDFRTVNTSAARYQQLSLNPLKLAGQCGKLKCCLNYELDSYLDALKDFPDMDGKKLLTKKGDAFLQKTDIFRKMMWFSYRTEPGVLIPMTIESVREIAEANAKGEQPDQLISAEQKMAKVVVIEPSFDNLVGQDALTRFDRSKAAKNKNKKGNNRPQNSQTQKTGEQKPAQNRPPQNAQNKQGSNQPRPQQPKKQTPQQNNQAKPQQNQQRNQGPKPQGQGQKPQQQGQPRKPQQQKPGEQPPRPPQQRRPDQRNNPPQNKPGADENKTNND